MSSRSKAILAAFLVSSMLFAGCFSGDEEPAPAATNAATSPTGASPSGTSPGAAALARWFEGDTLITSKQHEGTFTIDQHGFPSAALKSEAGLARDNWHIYDVSDMIPVGIPVLITAEVNADLARGDLDLFINAPDDAIWTRKFDAPFGGFTQFEILVVRPASGVIEVVVQYDEIDDKPTFSYTLDITTTADPELIPAGIPVGIDIPVGGSLALDFDKPGDSPVVWLWNPADGLVGHFPVTGGRFVHTLDEGVAGGEYVMMISQGGGSSRATVTGHEGTTTFAPRILRQDIQVAEMRESSDGKLLEWTFDSPRVPLQVGILILGADLSSEMDVEIKSPDATLMSFGISDDIPWLQLGFWTATPMGYPGLAAGNYQGRVAFGQAIEAQDKSRAAEVLVYYGR